MSPDDPRHGTYAGAMAHRRADVQLCLPCQVAARRQVKAAKLRLERGIRNRIPLGHRAWHILDNVGCTPVATQTGLWRNNLYRAHRNGPDGQVLRSTRDAILRAAGPTPIGVQRRVRALSVLGHTLETVAAVADVHPEGLGRMSRRSHPTTMIRPHMVAGVVAAYDALRDVKPAADRYTSRRRSTALGRGWLPPDVWDDIDDPDEDPLAEIDPDYIDPAVVERLLSGRRIPSSPTEKAEALRRWVESGGTQRSLCRLHGWQEGRYKPAAQQDGAA